MAVNITLPVLGGQKQGTKDTIISILSQKWPLSAKEIFNKLSREHDTNVSYQAVHKTLNELETEGVLEKNDRAYLLNRDWISNMKGFFSEMDSRYLDTNGKYEIDPDFEGTVKLQFKDYSLFCVTMAKMFAKQSLVGSRPSHGIGILRHAWWPLNFSFLDFDLLINMTKKNKECHVILKENAPFDKWIVGQYQKAGFTVITGIDLKWLNENDLVIHGDSIVKVKFSEDFNKKIDEVYERISGLKELYKEYLIQTLSKAKGQIEVTITKDPQLAPIIQKQFLKYFKGDGK